jgi:histidinol dehydrogenase
MYIATKIHNMSLGKVIATETYEEAIEIIKDMAKDILERELNEEELEDIDNVGELYIFNDHDNQYTFCVGITE